MLENLQIALSIAVGLVAGAIVALKVIAPKTKTLADDKVLEKLLALEGLLERLLPGSKSPAVAESNMSEPENKV